MAQARFISRADGSLGTFETLKRRAKLLLNGSPILLHGARILICEDEPFIALDLAICVEDAGGVVVGPAASIKEAQRLLKSSNIAGAILDVNLTDGHVGPVALELLKRGVPVVVQTGLALPSELAHLNELVAVFAKPVAPQVILGQLAKRLSIRRLLTR